MYENVQKYRGRKKKGKSKWRGFLFIFLAVVIAFVFYYFYVVSPIICSLSEEKIRSISTKVISNSVSQALTDTSFSYDDLVHISYNSQNEITLIQNDSIKINKLVRKVTELVQKEMDSLSEYAVDIALGTFTGIPFLYGIGPMVSLQLVPIGTVNTEFNSSFTSAGINQTRHSINFQITANVGMLLPANTQKFSTSQDVVICESVIVGKVPEFYFTGQCGLI